MKLLGKAGDRDLKVKHWKLNSGSQTGCKHTSEWAKIQVCLPHAGFLILQLVRIIIKSQPNSVTDLLQNYTYIISKYIKTN